MKLKDTVGKPNISEHVTYKEACYNPDYEAQGLDNTPNADSSYYTISTKAYTGFTGVDYVNFNGVFSYIRIVHIPATAPAESNNNNPSFFGSFDKVLYRS